MKKERIKESEKNCYRSRLILLRNRVSHKTTRELSVVEARDHLGKCTMLRAEYLTGNIYMEQPNWSILVIGPVNEQAQ